MTTTLSDFVIETLSVLLQYRNIESIFYSLYIKVQYIGLVLNCIRGTVKNCCFKNSDDRILQQFKFYKCDHDFSLVRTRLFEEYPIFYLINLSLITFSFNLFDPN